MLHIIVEQSLYSERRRHSTPKFTSFSPYTHLYASYSGSARADLTRLYPSLLRLPSFKITGAANKIPPNTHTTNNTPIPKLGPLNPKSAHVSVGSQIISSYPTGFMQCGPVQFWRHWQVCSLVLVWHTPRVGPPQVWGTVALDEVDCMREHDPPPFSIGFNG